MAHPMIPGSLAISAASVFVARAFSKGTRSSGMASTIGVNSPHQVRVRTRAKLEHDGVQVDSHPRPGDTKPKDDQFVVLAKRREVAPPHTVVLPAEHDGSVRSNKKGAPT